MESPRFYFRIAADELALLRKSAALAKKTTSEYARSAILRATREAAKEADEMPMRLSALEDSNRDIRALVENIAMALEDVHQLAAASVVSGALLRDDGKISAEDAKRGVKEHVELALSSAGSVRQLSRRKATL